MNDPTLYNREENKERFPFFSADTYEQIEVRDFAALQIAEMLGIKIKDDPKRTPAEWAKIRAQVQEAMKRELGKEKHD